MNHDRIAGKWKQFSGALRERWGTLTTNRRCIDQGKCEQSAGRAQELYGLNKQESERELREFLYRNRRWDISSR